MRETLIFAQKKLLQNQQQHAGNVDFCAQKTAPKSTAACGTQSILSAPQRVDYFPTLQKALEQSEAEPGGCNATGNAFGLGNTLPRAQTKKKMCTFLKNGLLLALTSSHTLSQNELRWLRIDVDNTLQNKSYPKVDSSMRETLIFERQKLHQNQQQHGGNARFWEFHAGNLSGPVFANRQNPKRS